METFLNHLIKDGLISDDQARLTPLKGGVSSDIYLVEDGDRKWVVKRALEKLKVEADWFADVSRNSTERSFIEYVSEFNPSAVPKIIGSGDGYFVMEYLGSGFRNWKEDLLAGTFDQDTAVTAGEILREIHHRSAGNEILLNQFDNMEQFWQLRIEPYLIATGIKHPRLHTLFEQEAHRLRDYRTTLIHGDFSPKNILTSKDRWVLLDCEVACYADPAFDVAFLLNHLLLKALYHKSYYSQIRHMAEEFWQAYLPNNVDLEARVSRLLLMLLLARVDGKSPVEYLVEEDDKNLVRDFSTAGLLANTTSLDLIFEKWFDALP